MLLLRFAVFCTQCVSLHCLVLCCVLLVPLNEVVDEVFNSIFHLRFLQWYWVALIGDLHNQLPQFVQLTLDLEQALCCQSEPEKGVGGVRGGRGEKRNRDRESLPISNT